MINTGVGYDVIIIGGGHNGLVCASYLAKTGLKVLVLEANAKPGGASATDAFGEQFLVSSCAHWLYQLNEKIASDLALKRHGLELAARNLSTTVLSEGGSHLTISGDTLVGSDVSTKDRAAFKLFNKQMNKFCELLSVAFQNRPPKLIDRNFQDLSTLIKLGFKMKMLGRNDMRDLMRMGLINIYDVMEENFDNDLLKAAISVDSILGSHLGPRSPNTVYGYLYRRMGDIFGYGRPGPAIVKGGMGMVGEAIANAAREFGVDIEFNSAVSSINVELDNVTGVTLEDGRIVNGAIVASSADPKTTFNKLVGAANLETGVVRRVKNMRMKGDAAKLHLALDELPSFKGLDQQRLGDRILIAPNMEYVENAFNHSKYGRYSENPIMDISIASVHDSSLAPSGKHVMSVIIQYAPYQLEGGWEGERKSFKNLVVERIAEYAPDLKSKIITDELLTPKDLEERYNLHGGHWHHGEIGLDQILMMRPFPGASQYKTALDGLFLCGSGAHPGGGIMGLSGHNAAKEIIGKIKGKRGSSA